ncbi:hypothetical protein [Kordia sp.]|uniref:hypothetical protein n=1 Tax=Kordia sp. TaxID=1965332 RepID=UPI003D2BC560
MKTPEEINKDIEATFDVLENINEVNVSPFFKDKTMQRLFAEKEEIVSTSFGWFTPKLQLATLVCILIVNVFGILQLTKTEYNDSISEFANAYELSQETQPSVFN